MIQIISHVALLFLFTTIDGFRVQHPSTSTTLFASPPLLDDNWYALNDCLVLLPPNERVPRSIIHFIGGFLAGSAPNIGYNYMLQELANKGHLIVASPLPVLNILNHLDAAESVQSSFYTCYQQSLKPILGDTWSNVPIIGLSHSLGGKIRILDECNPKNNRRIPTCANIFLAFNNFDARQSLDMTANASPELKKVMEAVQSPEVQRLLNLAKSGSPVKDAFTNNNPFESVTNMLSNTLNERLGSIFSDVDSRLNDLFNDFPAFDFTPTAAETWALLQERYFNPSNILIKFEDDDIDQSAELSRALQLRGFTPLMLTVKGTHVTPNVLVPNVGGEEASLAFNRVLGAQVNAIAEDNWGKSYRVKANERYLPDGRAKRGEASWDTDNY